MIPLAPTRIVPVTERGETRVSLTTAQARAVQLAGFCRVVPTTVDDEWTITDVRYVGVVAIDDLRIVIQPKTPVQSLVFMASYTGLQIAMDDAAHDYGHDDTVPVALATSLVRRASEIAARGLLKGYRETEESASVIRGRWDIARQINRRPGVPLPVELTYDDYTVDVIENRILLSALRAAGRWDLLPDGLRRQLSDLAGMFSEATPLRAGSRVPDVRITRLNQRYDGALRLARWILEAVSWTHASGATIGGTFLLNVADVFEKFIAAALGDVLREDGISVSSQFREWTLDEERQVHLRPDIVLSRGADVLTVADTKYKVWGEKTGSPPNADVYQSLAYAVTAGTPDAHLIYVSGDVQPRTYTMRGTGTRVVAHAIDLDGGPAELVERVRGLAGALVTSGSVVE